MRAVVVDRFGGPEVLTVTTVPDPKPEPGTIVVRVLAANVNPTDLAARQGFVIGGPVDLPLVLGWDFAGIVEAIGEGVSDRAVGERVVGMIPWYAIHGRVGAYAELVAADPSWVVPLPSSLDEIEAATIPLNALTARQALDLLAPEPGAEILVTGASGAVGSFATQLAIAAGHPVTAMAGRDDDAFVASLRATRVLPRDSDPAEVGPFRSVLDAVPLGAPALAAVADGGSIVATRPIPEADASRRIRQEVVLIRADHAALETLVAEVAAGRLRTRVARTLPFAEAAEAHRLVEAGGLHGKIVLVP
jgi:NADPH2:quinone reductase